MAKRLQRTDHAERTERLGIDELYVLKGNGSADYYETWTNEVPPECCPACGSKLIRCQDRFSRSYTDIIEEGHGIRPITLRYCFFKYRCMNETCRHIFSEEIEFASVNDNVTHTKLGRPPLSMRL